MSDLCFVDCFGDRRRDRRANELVAAIAERGSTVIRRLADNRTAIVRFYRLINNDAIDPALIIDQLVGTCARALEQAADDGTLESHLLVIEDSSEVNYQAHRGRITPDSGLGRVGNNVDLGWFVHASLCIGSDSGRVFGFSDVRYHTRGETSDALTAEARKRRPIEQKESHRWLAAAERSAMIIEAATDRSGADRAGTDTAAVPLEHVTIIADAEADDIQLYARCLEAERRASYHSTRRIDLVVASRSDRRIAEGTGMLKAHLAAQPSLGRFTVDVRADRRKLREHRSAEVEIRSARVHLLRPRRVSADAAPEQVPMTAIEVRETAESAAGGTAIRWLLLTTHPASSVEQARQVVEWYRKRWNIEQLFRTIKKKGLNLEGSELENGTALLRLGLLTLAAAVRVMLLLLARDGTSEQPLDDVFDADEQRCLEQIRSTFTGRGQDAHNPHPRTSIAWASWIIARLGGWKGLRSERPPGPITYFDGLQRFEQLYLGWRLARSAS